MAILGQIDGFSTSSGPKNMQMGTESDPNKKKCAKECPSGQNLSMQYFTKVALTPEGSVNIYGNHCG